MDLHTTGDRKDLIEVYKGHRMVTASETHQPGTEKEGGKGERERERERERKEREKRSGESEVPRSD